MHLEIGEFGMAKPDRLKMVAYAAAASLYGLTLNSGDKIALLKGTRLDEVAQASVGDVTFTPSTLDRVENLDQLQMNSAGSTDSLQAGKAYVALVELKDGRTLKAPVTVDQPRPKVTLLNEGIQEDGAAPLPVEMSSPSDLPVDSRLVFFLKSDVPADFPRDEKIEVAAADSSFRTTLALSDGSLMLEDAHTAEASLEPLARFGSSAFGPVRVRANLRRRRDRRLGSAGDARAHPGIQTTALPARVGQAVRLERNRSFSGNVKFQRRRRSTAP